VNVRTTIDMPDALFRRTKAVAAIRGTSLKSLIVTAIERELNEAREVSQPSPRRKPPVIHLSPGRKLDLTGFDFDDLLA
jgi:hypothetical protein